MLILLAATLAAFGDPTTPADVMATYAEAIAHSNSEALSRAFQPSAMMYCTDGESVTATYQSQSKARLTGALRPRCLVPGCGDTGGF